jgi:carboxypeptidase family protein
MTMRKLALPLLALAIALVVFLLTRGDATDHAKAIEQDAREAQEAPAVGELAPPAVEPVEQLERVEQAKVVAADLVEAPLDPQLARLVVTVVSREDWEPVGATPVFIDRSEPIAHELLEAGEIGTLGRGVRTDALGIARFDLEPGEKLRVFPRHIGFTPTAGEAFAQLGGTAFGVKPLAAGEVREQQIHMSTITGELHLLIVDEVNELPIEGAEVRRGPRVLARSDSEGRAVYDLAVGAYVPIKLRAEGFGPAIVPLRDRREGAEAPFIVRLRRAASVRGRVLGLDDPASFRVQFLTEPSQLTQPSGSLGFGIGGAKDARTAELDAHGGFEIDGLPTKVQVQALISDANGKWVPLQREPLYFEPGELRTLEWNQAGGASIRGRVVDSEGQPLAGETIGLQAGAGAISFGISGTDYLRRGTSDASGAFAFEDLRPGDYLVGVIASKQEQAGRGTAKVVAQVTVEAGNDVDDLELVVTSSVYLTGNVLGPDGEPVGGTTVLAYSNDLGMMHGKTEDDGAFRLGPLSPGEYNVMVMVGSKAGGAAPPESVVEVPCDPLEIRLLVGATLSGVAIDAQTGEAVHVNTSLHAALGELRSSSASGGGRTEFSYGALLPGTYHVSAIEPGGRVGILRNVVLESGQTLTGLEIRMQPAGVLDCSYRGERQDLELRIRVGEVILLAEPTFGGSHHVQRAPLGSCEVELVLADHATPATEREVIDHRTVQVIAGETIEVVFD